MDISFGEEGSVVRKVDDCNVGEGEVDVESADSEGQVLLLMRTDCEAAADVCLHLVPDLVQSFDDGIISHKNLGPGVTRDADLGEEVSGVRERSHTAHRDEDADACEESGDPGRHHDAMPDKTAAADTSSQILVSIMRRTMRKETAASCATQVQRQGRRGTGRDEPKDPKGLVAANAGAHVIIPV